MARGPIPDLSPARPTVPDVLPLVVAYRRDHPIAGRPLHCYLDDGNTGRSFVDPELAETPQEREILEKLHAMSGTQRRKVYRLVN